MKVDYKLLDDILRHGRKELTYEEVIEIIKDLSDRGYKVYRKAKEIAIEALEKQSDIDRVKIVRCKDCDVPHNKYTGCPKLNGLVTPPDFYCAFGRPKITEDIL